MFATPPTPPPRNQHFDSTDPTKIASTSSMVNSNETTQVQNTNITAQNGQGNLFQQPQSNAFPTNYTNLNVHGEPFAGAGNNVTNNIPRRNEDGWYDEIASKSVRIPEFWDKCPDTWFVILENYFKARNIRLDVTKIQHVLSVTPQHIALTVSDVIKSPFCTYDQLKDALIKRHTMSEEQRLNSLFNSSTNAMGDRKPSELYRHMSQLADSGTGVDNNLLVKLWMRNLPKSINIALVASGQTEHNQLIMMADRIYESINQESVFAIQSTNHPGPSNHTDYQISEMRSGMTEIVQEIQTLRKEINVLREQNQRHTDRRQFSRSHSRSSSRHRHSSRQRQDHETCWYHWRFGDKATKCHPPCKLNGVVAPKN